MAPSDDSATLILRVVDAIVRLVLRLPFKK